MTTTNKHDTRKFETFIRSLQLKNFKPSEFLIGLDRGNTVPPVSYWHNIVIPALVWQRVRSHYGKPVTLTSTYRNAQYNRAEDGRPNSQHLVLGANDGKVKGVSPEEVAALIESWRGELFDIPFRLKRNPHPKIPFWPIETWDERHGPGSKAAFIGGVGIYETFVHVDCRGKNVSWARIKKPIRRMFRSSRQFDPLGPDSFGGEDFKSEALGIKRNT